jgi:outer membrane lipoprotein-sorting protein
MRPVTTRIHHLTLLLAILFLPALVPAASGQTADEVVEKHLAALGGREALGKLTSRKTTGTITVATEAGDIPGSAELYVKQPNKSRAFMKLDLSAMGAGEMTIDQRFDGSTGSMMNSMQGDTAITGNQLENMRNNVFPSALLNYKAAGTKVELQDKAKLGDKDAIVLLITPKSGSPIRMFLDPDTYLIARTVTTINSPQMGGDVETIVDLSDYRAVDGVKVPFHVVNSNPMQTLTIKVDKVEHNVPIDDAMFVKK